MRLGVAHISRILAMLIILAAFFLLKTYIGFSRNEKWYMVQNPANMGNISTKFPVHRQMYPIKKSVKFPSHMKHIEFSSDLGAVPFQCINTRTTPNFTVCLHDIKTDIWISAKLIKEGVFDSMNANAMHRAFAKYPMASLIDIGGNIGYFTLFAAAHGRNVVAVEPVLDNINRFRASVYLNKFGKQITLFMNAVSDELTEITMSTSSDNQGGVFVLSNGEHPSKQEPVKHTVSRISNQKLLNRTLHNSRKPVKTIFMDDLIPAVTTKIAILKIDIEGHECRALRKSSRLFKAVFIPYIIMEWVFVVFEKKRATSCRADEVKEMRKFLVWMGYSAFVPGRGSQLEPLDPARPNWGSLTTVI